MFKNSFYIQFSLFLIRSTLWAELPFGLIGGGDVNTQSSYVAYFSSPQVVTPIILDPSTGVINSVSINSSGLGLIGGSDTTFSIPYAALVSPPNTLKNLNLGTLQGGILSVAINNKGQGLIGGFDFNNSATCAATISPEEIVTPLSLGSGSVQLFSVSINETGRGLVGGWDVNLINAYAATVSPTGEVTSLAPDLPLSGWISSVAINNQGQGLILGLDFNTGAPYVGSISPSGQVTQITTNIPSTGSTGCVAINSSGRGLIAGQETDGTSPAYARLLSETGSVSSLNLNLATGRINSVAINSAGQGLMGGVDLTSSASPYAAIVTFSGNLIPLDLGVSKGEIFSVAINSVGQGLIGGGSQNDSQPYLALVSPLGLVTPITLDVPIVINSVSCLISLLSTIPTQSLSGNNLAFANYINKYAPENAFYFVPSILDNTLSKALESAASTRNAFSLWSIDNNLFNLAAQVSNHFHNTRSTLNLTHQSASVAMNEKFSDALAASSSDLTTFLSYRKQQQQYSSHSQDSHTQPSRYNLWGTVLGNISYQKSQHQSPSFQPTTAGAVLGFDAKISNRATIGSGAAYAYTQIDEKMNAGHSTTHQEYLFINGLWNGTHLYFDTALWGGIFQVKNTRNIKMSQFKFRSKSDIKGWQLSPSFEIGYNFNLKALSIEPFGFANWVNNWQLPYEESGRSPFNIGQKKHYSSFLRSEIGIRMYEKILFNHWYLSFQEKLSYVNKKPFEVGTINGFLVGSSGLFTVETLTAPQNLGTAQLQLLFEPLNSNYPYAAIDYQGEFGSMYQAHTLALNLSWNF